MKPKVLVIDDEKNTRDGLREALADDYDVLLAEDGVKGLALLDANPEDAAYHTPAVLDLETRCFDLEGYHLQVTDLSGEKQIRWIRWRQKPAK